MNKLLAGFDYVHAYINDLLVIRKGSFEEHLNHLDAVLEELEPTGLKINTSKSCVSAQELEYLGNWISQDSIQLLAAKLKSSKMAKTKKQARWLFLLKENGTGTFYAH